MGLEDEGCRGDLCEECPHASRLNERIDAEFSVKEEVFGLRKGLKDRELSSIFGGIGFAQDEGGNDEGATDGEEDDENALPRGEREDDAAQNG